MIFIVFTSAVPSIDILLQIRSYKNFYFIIFFFFKYSTYQQIYVMELKPPVVISVWNKMNEVAISTRSSEAAAKGKNQSGDAQ